MTRSLKSTIIPINTDQTYEVTKANVVGVLPTHMDATGYTTCFSTILDCLEKLEERKVEDDRTRSS